MGLAALGSEVRGDSASKKINISDIGIDAETKQ